MIDEAVLKRLGYGLVRVLSDGRWAVLIVQFTNSAIGIVRDEYTIAEKW